MHSMDETRTATDSNEAPSPPSTEPETGFPPGTVLLERYRIEGRLGVGGMGTVYLAEDERLRQRVALKFLAPKFADDPRTIEMLTNEVRLARQVTHPNVCRVHDLGEYDGRPFLSMEYVDGEDLKSLLRRIGRLTGEKAHEIARQLCAGLDAAHRQGVLHRDLKPANVMIDGQGHARITDFGVASPAGTTADGPTVGTPAYMAPELFHGEAASVESDVYALGLCLYELYTGRKLHDVGSLTALVEAHARPARPPSTIVPDLPSDVERVILACLSREPKQRPPSAIAVLAELPGGDPLAESLAAGQTPSPELIARAGGRGDVDPRFIAVALGVLVLSLSFLMSVDTDAKLIGRVPLPHSPEVLADRARSHLLAIGFDVDRVSAAHRFRRVLGRIEEIHARAPREPAWRAELARPRGAPLEFWYRQVPLPARLEPAGVKGRITWDDPPIVTPGMAQVRLDPEGRLIELIAVPDAAGATSSTADSVAVDAKALDWSRLLATAGLDAARLERATPRFTPRTFADERAAWTGVDPEDASVAIRVEAASFQGRPVALQLTRVDSAPEPAPTGRTWRSLAQLFLILGALILAWDAYRRRRGDLRGAFRVGIAVFALVVLFTLFGGDHGSTWIGVGQLLMKGMTHGVAVAALLGMFYFAFEPHARHIWPQTMLGWSRVLIGRFMDPRVGRDLLVGLAMGALWTVVLYLTNRVPAWSGCVGPKPLFLHQSSLEVLRGVGPALGAFLEVVVDLARESFKIFTTLVLLRVLFKNAAAAAIGTAVVWGFVFLGPDPHADDWIATSAPWLLAATLGASFSFVLVRFGLLALVVAWVMFGLLTTFPLAIDPAHWNAGVAVLGLAMIAAAATFGVIAARAPTRRVRP